MNRFDSPSDLHRALERMIRARLRQRACQITIIGTGDRPCVKARVPSYYVVQLIIVAAEEFALRQSVAVEIHAQFAQHPFRLSVGECVSHPFTKESAEDNHEYHFESGEQELPPAGPLSGRLLTSGGRT